MSKTSPSPNFKLASNNRDLGNLHESTNRGTETQVLDFVFCCEQCTQQRQVSPLSEQPPESEGDKSNKRRPKILPSSFSEKEAHWRFQLNIFYASQTMLHIPAKYGSTQGKCCIELAKMGMVRKICLESSMDKIEIRCRCNTTCNFL